MSSNSPSKAAQMICDAFNANLFDALLDSKNKLTVLFNRHSQSMDEIAADKLIGHCGINGEIGNGLYFAFSMLSDEIQHSNPAEHPSLVDEFLKICNAPSQMSQISKYMKDEEGMAAHAGETKITAMKRCHDNLDHWLRTQNQLPDKDRAGIKAELDAFSLEAKKIEDVIAGIKTQFALEMGVK